MLDISLGDKAATFGDETNMGLRHQHLKDECKNKDQTHVDDVKMMYILGMRITIEI